MLRIRERAYQIWAANGGKRTRIGFAPRRKDPNSLLTGKFTGNFVEGGALAGLSRYNHT